MLEIVDVYIIKVMASGIGGLIFVRGAVKVSTHLDRIDARRALEDAVNEGMPEIIAFSFDLDDSKGVNARK